MLPMRELLAKISAGGTLTRREMHDALVTIACGEAQPSQTGAFLMGLSQRGETAEEIIGAVDFLKSRVDPVMAPDGAIDCCGTGGDVSGTYNISTAAALVLAGCGLPVAKHGNRAASSKSGAADVLEALGVNLDISKTMCEAALSRFNFCFLMAPHHHAVLKPLSALRHELGFRTVFNLLGPLANPAGTKLQLIGVYDRKLLDVFAKVLAALGTRKAWIVHGEDGLDEITLTGKTFCLKLDEGRILRQDIAPSDFGLGAIDPQDIKGGTAQDNAAALRALLEGRKTAYRDIVLANAAAALTIAGRAENLKDGVAMAARSIDDGSALAVLDSYIEFTTTPMRLKE